VGGEGGVVYYTHCPQSKFQGAKLLYFTGGLISSPWQDKTSAHTLYTVYLVMEWHLGVKGSLFLGAGSNI